VQIQSQLRHESYLERKSQPECLGTQASRLLTFPESGTVIQPDGRHLLNAAIRAIVDTGIVSVADDIFLCFNCGQRNRVASGSDRKAARCGSCSKALFPNEAAQASKGSKAREPTPQYSLQPRQPMAGKAKLGWLAVAGAVVWFVYSASQPTVGRSTATIPTGSETYVKPSIPAVADLPPPIQQSTGVLWNSTGREAEAPLRIETTAGSDYYVKLKDALTNGDAMAIYVRGGQALEIDVPLGSYRFLYAVGTTWRGERALFGPETSYNEAGDVFNFDIQGDTINGYTVELISQPNGNLSTRAIDASSF
jgi:hypothetical protein